MKDGIQLSNDEVEIILTPVIEEATFDINLNDVTANLSEDNKTVTYEVNDTISYDYTLTYMGIKEDIVLEEYTGINTFDFIIDTNGLEVYKDERN